MFTLEKFRSLALTICCCVAPELMLLNKPNGVQAQLQETYESGAPNTRCSAYPLGSGDQIVVRGMNWERINETLTIDADGFVNIPLIGRYSSAGLTVEEFQRELNNRLKAYIREPNV